jgi:integrase/recombinase XerD
MSHLSRWLEAEGLDVGDLTPALAERFLAARRTAGYPIYLTPNALPPLLAYLRGLAAIPQPPSGSPIAGS